jgi:hypothetical protein
MTKNINSEIDGYGSIDDIVSDYYSVEDEEADEEEIENDEDDVAEKATELCIKGAKCLLINRLSNNSLESSVFTAETLDDILASINE